MTWVVPVEMLAERGPAKLPYRDHGCAAARDHRPEPVLVDLHHVYPKYLQARAFGIDESALTRDPRFVSTTTPLCGSCHEAVHYVVERMLRNASDVGTDRRAIVRLARRAVDLYRLDGGR